MTHISEIALRAQRMLADIEVNRIIQRSNRGLAVLRFSHEQALLEGIPPKGHRIETPVRRAMVAWVKEEFGHRARTLDEKNSENRPIRPLHGYLPRHHDT